MQINLTLTKENVKLFCENFECAPKEIEHILMAYMTNDTESQYYRDLAFNVEKFLLSKQVGELIIMRSAYASVSKWKS